MNQLGDQQSGTWSPAREEGKEQESNDIDADADDDNDDDADAKVEEDDDDDDDDDANNETLFECQDFKAWNNLILMWDINQH